MVGKWWRKRRTAESNDEAVDDAPPPSEAAPAQQIPTVRFDRSSVTEEIIADIRRQVAAIASIPNEMRAVVEQDVIESILRGRDLGLCVRSLQGAGLGQREAIWIASGIHNRATSMVHIDRQLKLGLKEARWQSTKSAGCFIASNPPPEDVALRARLHEEQDGKRFWLDLGLLVDGEYIFPGQEYGCKCHHAVIIPGFND